MNISSLRFTICVISIACCSHVAAQTNTIFIPANNPFIQYTGRIDFTDSTKPRFWSSGVYIQAEFTGSYCNILINDEVLYGNSHNYIEIVIDNKEPFKVQTSGKTNIIKAAEGLSEGNHKITICKNTESGIGYLEFTGLQCKSILSPAPKPLRKIEFIGNSITTGTGMDISAIPCDKGQWYDQHNAYLSYGPLTARALNAQWHLSAVAGIGLIHSCCKMNITMPEVFDKLNMRNDSIVWKFNNYQPDVVTVCLGQNDGKQDSVIFCDAYIQFIKKLRGYYPHATIVCLSSPMADEQLTIQTKRYLGAIINFENNSGDNKIYNYFFSKRYHNGCGGHPDLEEHRLIANELTAYIKNMMQW